VKGKLVNGMGNQYLSHYLGTWCMQYYYALSFAERRNLVSAPVPSHFNWSLLEEAHYAIVLVSQHCKFMVVSFMYL